MKKVMHILSLDGRISNAELQSIYAWLKSLRPQNNITDEELAQAKKNAYNDALDKIEYHSGEPTFDDGWSAAIDYIRKKFLIPQNAYNPYKAVVESIAEMCKHYDKASHSGLRDFYDNVKVKCKDAKEYDKMFQQAQWKPSDEQMELLSEVQSALLGKDCHNRFTDFMWELKKLKEEQV